jgi:predicted phage terminase large subunit-like protein
MSAALWPPPLPAIDAERERRSRDHLLTFVRRMFPRYEAAAHHHRIADALERVERGACDRLLIIMPPRHGKSELASKHFPAWYLGRHPEKRVIACSYTASLAYRFSRQARNIVADARWPFDVGLAGDLAAVQSWDLDTGGGYIAAGVGGSITGQGADLLIIDDPVKSADDADSEVKRDSTWQWYQDTAYPRLHDGAAVIVIGTRWHDDDLIGRLLAAHADGADQWEVLHLPAITDAGEPLWPERYPIPELLRRKANMSSRMWEAQYQGQPLPATGGMFPRAWWSRYRELPTLTRLELVLDSAFKEGVSNDYSALALWGADGQGSAYLIRVWWKRLDFPKLIRQAHDAFAWSREQFPDLPLRLVIEDKASGQSALQVLKQPYHTASGALPALPVVPFTIDGTQSKIARAEGVAGVVEGGRACIPEQAAWLDDWLAEHERFPLGAHDDQVDTTAMALTRLLLTPRKKVRIY